MRMPDFRHFTEPGRVDIDSFPVIAKKRISSRGRGIFIMNNQEDLDAFLKERNVSDYFFEQRISITKDIRVLLIDNEIMAAVERRVRIKDNQGFDGIGVKVTGEYNIPENLKDRFVGISRRSGSDFCGIDFVIDENGEEYLLEVNISPQFIALERALKINVAGRLMDFISGKA